MGKSLKGKELGKNIDQSCEKNNTMMQKKSMLYQIM